METTNEQYVEFARDFNSKLIEKISHTDSVEKEKIQIAKNKLIRNQQFLANQLERQAISDSLTSQRAKQDEDNKNLLIDKEEQVDFALEQDLYDEISLCPNITITDAINAIRMARSNLDTENQSHIIEMLNRGIATMQVAWERAVVNPKQRSGHLFPEWTKDGYKLILRRRPKAILKMDYATATDVNAYLKCWTHHNINSRIETNYNYYVSAFSCDNDGHEYTMYMGTYDSLLKDVSGGRTLFVKEYCSHLATYEKVEAKTSQWRKEQLRKRALIGE